MELGWFCKHGNVKGIIDPPLRTELRELATVVIADHAKHCDVAGTPWVLIDTQRPGILKSDPVADAVIEVDVTPIELDGPLFIVLHVR